VQRVEEKLEEHIRATTMLKFAMKYNVQMTNIFLELSNLEIHNKQIIEEKNRYVQNRREL
jgi:hypothetical protein